MDNLQIKFTEIYRIVPVGIEEHLEDCKGMLHDLEDKVAPSYLIVKLRETLAESPDSF